MRIGSRPPPPFLQGAAFLALLVILVQGDLLPPGRATAALLGLGAGAALDLCLYLPLREVTDAAYDGSWSRAGAGLGAALCLLPLLGRMGGKGGEGRGRPGGTSRTWSGRGSARADESLG